MNRDKIRLFALWLAYLNTRATLLTNEIQAQTNLRLWLVLSGSITCVPAFSARCVCFVCLSWGSCFISFVLVDNFFLLLWRLTEKFLHRRCVLSWQESQPLTPKNDQHLISLHITTTESNIEVMRKWKMNTQSRSSWLLNKFSFSIPYEMYTKQWGEYAYWC